MAIHIDYAPVKCCKNPDTYGVICVKCNKCGRFDYGGESNPVRSDIRIVEQFNEGFPPIWRYPKEFGGYYTGEGIGKPDKKCWFRSDKLIKDGTMLRDIISEWWYPDRLDHLRWWIEGINY